MPQGHIARWMEAFSQFHMVVKHRAGDKHVNPDALSRIPETLTHCSSFVAGIKSEDLPCGGCAYCTRVHSLLSFLYEVDDVVHLAVDGTLQISEVNTAEKLSQDISGDRSTDEIDLACFETLCTELLNADTPVSPFAESNNTVSEETG